MKIAIIVSKKDPAGMNIKQCLLELYSFKETEDKFDDNPVFELDNTKLYTVNNGSVHCENIDQKINADLFIFATKHQSVSGIHSLCVHSPGNWSKADFGGEDNKLCVSPALYLAEGLIKLKELNQNLDYEIIQECTHHGPSLEKPVMFIEIGSKKEQWIKKKAGLIIAKTIKYLLTIKPKQRKVALGLGGPHHCPNFMKLIYKEDLAFSHVCPKYNINNFNNDLLDQAITKSEPKVELIVLDWKGLGNAESRNRIFNLVENKNIKIKKIK